MGAEIVAKFSGMPAAEAVLSTRLPNPVVIVPNAEKRGGLCKDTDRDPVHCCGHYGMLCAVVPATDALSWLQLVESCV